MKLSRLLGRLMLNPLLQRTAKPPAERERSASLRTAYIRHTAGVESLYEGIPLECGEERSAQG